MSFLSYFRSALRGKFTAYLKIRVLHLIHGDLIHGVGMHKILVLEKRMSVNVVTIDKDENMYIIK